MAQERSYERWLSEARELLRTINIDLDHWQQHWRFDFADQYSSGIEPRDAAVNANRFWWYQQNKAVEKNCNRTENCWLPVGHQVIANAFSFSLRQLLITT